VEPGEVFVIFYKAEFLNLIMRPSYSMLPALSVDGIIYSHIKEGSYNGDQFLLWLQGLLAIMNPYPAPKSVLVLDNCRIHHVEGVEELCEER
jgi:transposase